MAAAQLQILELGIILDQQLHSARVQIGAVWEVDADETLHCFEDLCEAGIANVVHTSQRKLEQIWRHHTKFFQELATEPIVIL